MSDIFTEIGQVVLTSLLSLAAMFIFTLSLIHISEPTRRS